MHISYKQLWYQVFLLNTNKDIQTSIWFIDGTIKSTITQYQSSRTSTSISRHLILVRGGGLNSLQRIQLVYSKPYQHGKLSKSFIFDTEKTWTVDTKVIKGLIR